jgi:hypothetical protein
MCDDFVSVEDIEKIATRLGTIIDQARSTAEIEAWLRSQKCVKSVELADYLLKSDPPQRDFIVEFRLQDGSTLKKVVNMYDLGNERYRFHELRDQ